MYENVKMLSENWSTHVKFPKSPFQIRLGDPIFAMGSCFADLIPQQLSHLGWPTFSNPFGISYNPHSLYVNLQISCQRLKLSPHDWFSAHELYHHWDLHSRMSDISRQKATTQLESQIQACQSFLKDTHIFLFTLGSAHVFQHKESQKIVSNCHKMPAHHFEQRFLSASEIHRALSSIGQLLQNENPSAKIIWSVSPVRHKRIGLIENNRSKAKLIDALHLYLEGKENMYYFPAYEILMDELRDYRFYAADRVHPSKEASDYIFKNFIKNVFDNEAQELLEKLQKFSQMKAHKSRFKETQASKDFEKKKERIAADLQSAHPWLLPLI